MAKSVTSVQHRSKTGAPTTKNCAELFALWKNIGTCAKKYEKKKVDYFYHATSQANQEQIAKFSLLDSQQMTYDNDKDSEFPLSSNKKIKGVWFCATLYREELPTISPYGDRRIRIPVDRIVTADHQMFFESTHYYRTDTQYIRFVLVKKDQKRAIEWCTINLVEVDLTDNQIFTFNETTGYAECLENKHHTTVNIWVEILVVGDVSTIGMPWTPVRKTANACKPSIAAISPLFE